MIRISLRISMTANASQNASWLMHSLEVYSHGPGTRHWNAATSREAIVHSDTAMPTTTMGLRYLLFGANDSNRAKVDNLLNERARMKKKFEAYPAAWYPSYSDLDNLPRDDPNPWLTCSLIETVNAIETIYTRQWTIIEGIKCLPLQR